MKKASLAVLVSFSVLTSAAFAQEEQGIRESHDPQVAAQIEQHAQEAQSSQQEAPMAHPEHMQRMHKMHRHNMHHHAQEQQQ